MYQYTASAADQSYSTGSSLDSSLASPMATTFNNRYQYYNPYYNAQKNFYNYNNNQETQSSSPIATYSPSQSLHQQFNNNFEFNVNMLPSVQYGIRRSEMLSSSIDYSSTGNQSLSSSSSSYINSFQSLSPDRRPQSPVSATSAAATTTFTSPDSSSSSINVDSLTREQEVFVVKSSKSSKRATVSRRHQQLPEEAVDIMNEWFTEHINNPYPTQIEKERLADECKITIKQVTAWFSNRRNRSQYTKPKRMQRVLENKMTGILNELATNPNKDEIIEKFKHTLSSTQHLNI